jgi:hypothetical protein
MQINATQPTDQTGEQQQFPSKKYEFVPFAADI